MSKNRDLLEKIAGDVADGTPVNWDVERTIDPELRGRLRFLKIIAGVHAVYRNPVVRGPESESDPSLTRTDDLATDVGTGVEETADPRRETALGSWGRLHILRKIGEGSYGEVFLARDPALDRPVALKLLKPRSTPEEADGVIHEGKKLARIRHPNVLAVHGAEKHEGRIGIWTDYIEGKTLEQTLQDQGPLGPEETALVGVEMLRALAAVHATGLVHRDVKTTNVMREKGGRIVLMDFGAAIDRPSADATAGPVGTAVYMAPELFRGGSSGVAADIYSVGVVLFRLATGRFPVEGETFADIMAQHRAGEPKRLRDLRPDLPASFVQVVERALSPDPCSRYRSVGEFEQAISGPLGSAPSRRAGVPRLRWVMASIVSAAALVVVALLGKGILSPGGLDAKASLFRSTGGVEERLHAGGRVEPGDQLFLEVEASESVHLYVFNEDNQGESYLLFPLSTLDLQNPLPGKTTHRIPGTAKGSQQLWTVTSSGGRETIYVIAARKPLQDLEASLASLPEAGSGSPLPLTHHDLGVVLRGIGGISPEPASTPGASPTTVSAVFERIEEQTSKARTLWTWKVDLENP